MTSRLAPLISTCLLLAACGGDLISGPEQRFLLQRLRAAEARWERDGPSTYAFTLDRVCFCGVNGPVRINVVNDVVTEVRLIATDEVLPTEWWQWYPSIRELFVILEDAITLPAGEVTVKFDSALGHPTEAYIDWYSNSIDDEVSYSVSQIDPALAGTKASAP